MDLIDYFVLHMADQETSSRIVVSPLLAVRLLCPHQVLLVNFSGSFVISMFSLMILALGNFVYAYRMTAASRYCFDS